MIQKDLHGIVQRSHLWRVKLQEIFIKYYSLKENWKLVTDF